MKSPASRSPRSEWKWVLLTLGGGGAIIGLAALLSRRRAAAATIGGAGGGKGIFGDAARPTAVSLSGTMFVAQFEGFFPKPYNDPAGHCTVGFGHLIHRGPCDGNEPVEFKRGLTRARALALLETDLREAAATVAELVTVPLRQAQFDALTSFVFNVGPRNFRSSTLLRLLNQGAYGSVPAQLDRFVYASGRKLPGLVSRRKAEGHLFATGDYGDAVES